MPKAEIENKTPEKETISSLDIIAGTFAFSTRNKFTTDRYLLHSFFYQKKETLEYRQVLSHYGFSKYDIYPFSRKLEEAFSWLQLADILSLDNPKYGTWTMDPKIKNKMQKRFEEIGKVDDINKEKVDKLKLLGKEFDNYLDTIEKKKLKA